mmetsp:Transcript_39265/g.79332  ORF Transcript_39265/g.79332 Transcript_39265/m.79332 type:complete len:86 (-) Transcript_39265:14-271(-)
MGWSPVCPWALGLKGHSTGCVCAPLQFALLVALARHHSHESVPRCMRMVTGVNEPANTGLPFAGELLVQALELHKKKKKKKKKKY